MSDETSGNGNGIVAIVAIVILAGLAVLFFMYGLPMIQKNNASTQGTTIDVKLQDTTKPTQPVPTTP